MKEYIVSSMQSSSLKRVFMDNRNKCANIGSCMRLKGKMDADVFKLAAQKVFDRHEALRTKYVEHDGEFYMQVVEDYKYELDLRIATGDTTQERFEDAMRIYNEQLSDLHNPFEETTGFIFLVKIDENDHLLCFICGHNLSDGYSLSIVCKDILMQFISHGHMPLKPVAQYREYAEYEKKLLESEDAKEKEKYWTDMGEMLKTRKCNTLELIVDNQVKAEFGTIKECKINAEQKQKLVKVAKKNKASVFNVLMAVFHKTLHDIYDSEITFMQIATANREEKVYRETVGLFAKVVPDIIEHDEADTQDTLISKTKSRMNENLKNAIYLKNFRAINPCEYKNGFLLTYQNYTDYPINEEKKIMNYSFSMIMPKEEMRFAGGCCFFGYETAESILFTVNWDDSFFTGEFFDDFFKRFSENIVWICEHK